MNMYVCRSKTDALKAAYAHCTQKQNAKGVTDSVLLSWVHEGIVFNEMSNWYVDVRALEDDVVIRGLGEPVFIFS